MSASASSPAPAGDPDATRWAAPIEASAGVLELVGSEQPELLEFTAHLLATGTMSFAVEKLATDVGVAPERLGWTFERACRDLDRLEKHRGRWRDPVQILPRSNLAALRLVCHARLLRMSLIKRRQRLETIQRKIEKAWKLARTRAWIDDFLGELPSQPREARHAEQ